MWKITFIGLKSGQDLRNWAPHPHQEFPGVPPTPRGYIPFLLKLPEECDPTISDHTKQHCRNKRSMITPEA